MKNKIKTLIKKIETYKKDLHEDAIFIETTLSVLKYLLTEDISTEQRKLMFDNIINSTKNIKEKIDKIEENI